MEKNVNEQIGIFGDYKSLEDKLKELLNTTAKKAFNMFYNGLSENEIGYLKINNANEIEIDWILNINSIQTNRGDISTSSLQKVILYLKISFIT
jgi:hypothetical protein